MTNEPPPPPQDSLLDSGLPAVSARRILLQNGPRLARDSLGPIAGFYLGYKLWNLAVGILLACAVAIAFYLLERRQGRPGGLVRLSLALVLVQAVVGLISRDPRLYLAQPVIIDVIIGLVFLGSTLIRRPVIGLIAKESYPFPEMVASSATFGRIFNWLSALWGLYFLARATIRLATLVRAPIDVVIAVYAVTDVPFIVALIAFSIWYGVHGFRSSAEWGPAILERERT